MNTVWTITQIAIKENLRNKMIYFIFAMVIFFLLIGRGCNISSETSGSLHVISTSPENIAMQIAFHFISLWSIVLCCLLSMFSLSKEMEAGTIVMTLARPVSRAKFAAGKLLSVLIVSISNLFLLGSIFFLLFYSKLGVANYNLFLSFFLIAFSLVFVAIGNFLLSLIIPRIAIPVVILLIYIFSAWTELPFYFEEIGKMWEPSSATTFINKILPQLGELQFIGASLINDSISLNDCFLCILNVVLFSIAGWFVMMFIFKKSEV